MDKPALTELKLLALGRTAELYAWDDEWVLKLYFDWFDPEDARLEQRLTRVVHDAGLPIPAVGQLVELENRIGMLIERLNGISMEEVISRRSARGINMAFQLAELHAEMHSLPVDIDLPSLRRRLEQKIQHATVLDEDTRHKALVRLSRMLDGDCICHGDFHPGNILITDRGPMTIDWIDTAVGDPLADVARTSILALGSAATTDSVVFRLLIRLMHKIYLWKYFQLRPGRRDIYQRWIPIVAAGRLDEGITELDSWLLKQARKGC